MAIETVKKKGLRRKKLLTIIILSLSLLFTSCTEQEIEDSVNLVVDVLYEVISSETAEETLESNEETLVSVDTLPSEETVNVEGEMAVHFIDVGQADATLFIQNGKVMLFDAATENRGDELVAYIKALGIDYIDVLVLTHPHDDHMGGSAEVLNNIEVGIVYGPDILDIYTIGLDSPDWFDFMVDAINTIDDKRNEGIPEEEQTSIWHFPRDENGEFVKFNIGDAVVEFFAPLEDEYSDKNDYSICAKVTFGTVDIFLTGDATKSVEKALIEKGYDLDVEIFQASHHGSETGNSREFLKAMTPECIVISCGMKNRHNHPHKSVLELYEEMEISVYRTDESGDIIMTTDGTDYDFNVAPGTYTSGEEYKEGN